jgi:hypothetical protein
MANAVHRQTGQYSKDAQAFIARYLEIHDAQARFARTELDRLRCLIDDASARLMASFDVISTLSGNGRKAVQTGSDAVTQDIVQAVDNAVSALQFQDMANQLVGHAVQRIELLEKITESLGRLPEVSVDELTQAVDATTCAHGAGPVDQACMTGGSVDLF